MAWDDWGNDDSDFQYDFGQSPPLPSYPADYDYGSRPQKKIDFGLDTERIQDKFGKIWDVPSQIAENDDMLKEFILRQRSEDSKTNDYRYQPEPMLIPKGKHFVTKQPEPVAPIGDDPNWFWSAPKLEDIKNIGIGTGRMAMGMGQMIAKGPTQSALEMSQQMANNMAVHEATRKRAEGDTGLDYGNVGWEGAKALSPIPLEAAGTVYKGMKQGFGFGEPGGGVSREAYNQAWGELLPILLFESRRFGGGSKPGGGGGGGDSGGGGTGPGFDPSNPQPVEQYPGGDPFGEVSNIPPRQTGHMGGEDISLSPEGRYNPAGIASIDVGTPKMKGFQRYVAAADKALGRQGPEPLPEAQEGFNVNRTVFDALTPERYKPVQSRNVSRSEGEFLPSSNQRWMDTALPEAIRGPAREANFGLDEPGFKAGVQDAPLVDPAFPERPVEGPQTSNFDPQYTDFADAGSWGGRDTGLTGRPFDYKAPTPEFTEAENAGAEPYPHATEPPIPPGLEPVAPVEAPPVEPDLNLREQAPEGMSAEEAQAYMDEKLRAALEERNQPEKLHPGLSAILPTAGEATTAVKPGRISVIQRALRISFSQAKLLAEAEARGEPVEGLPPESVTRPTSNLPKATPATPEAIARGAKQRRIAQIQREHGLSRAEAETVFEEEAIGELSKLGGDDKVSGSASSKLPPDEELPQPGMGMDKGKSFEEQWKQAVAEARILGIDPSEFTNLEHLQHQITMEAGRVREARGGINPLSEAIRAGRLEPDSPSTLEHVVKPERGKGPSEPIEGAGLDTPRGVSFEEQWAKAIKEAKILGIDYKKEANLNELQMAVSEERLNQIEKTGKDPIIQAAVTGKGGLKDIEELANWDLESHFPETKIQGSAPTEEGPLKSVEEFPSTADDVVKGKFGKKPLEDIPAFEKKGVAEMPKKGGIGSKLTPAEKAEIQRAIEESRKPKTVEVPVKMGYRMPHDSRSFGLSEAGKFILDMKPTGKSGFDKLITRMKEIANDPELTIPLLEELRDLGKEATRHPDAPPNFRQEYYSKSADASGAPPTLGPLEPPISPEKIGALSKGEKAYNVGDEPLKLGKGPMKEIPMAENPLYPSDLRAVRKADGSYDIIGPDYKKLGEVNKAWFRNGGEGWTYDSMRGHKTLAEAIKYFARDQRQRLRRGEPIDTKPPEDGGKIQGSAPIEEFPHETEKLSSVEEFPSESNDEPLPKNIQGSAPEAFDPNWRPEDLNKPEKLATDGQKVIDEIKKSPDLKADERLQKALDEAQNRVNEIKAGKATFGKRWTQRGKSLAEAYRRYVGKSEEQTLADMGSGGKKLVDMMQRIISDAHNFAGKQSLALDAKMKGISKEQFAQAVDVVEGKGKSTDPAVNALADEINNQLATVGPELYGKTLKVKNPVTGRLEPFKAREKYFPHTYEEGFSISEKSMPELLRSIQEEFKVSAEKAQQILDDAKENNYRTLDAMKSRLRNLPGYRKEYDVLMNHFIDMAKRAKEEEIFGENTLQGKQENAVNTELNKILAEKGKAARVRAEGIVNTFLEKAPSRAESWQTEAANAVTSIQAFSKLSRSIIKNIPGGLVAGIAKAETLPWMKSIAETFTKNGRDFAKESGTLVSLWRDSAKDIGYGSKGSKIFGIEQGERWLRTFSANLGKNEANVLFDRIKARGGKAKPREVAQLNDLLVEDDIASVLKQDKLTEAQLARAANRMTDLTQGRADSLALPERWTNNPAANVITQFKKFGFIQARNMKNAIKQNPMALPRILIAQQILGGLANVVSSAVTGRERKKGIAGLIENASYAFGFGMISDALDASTKGGERAITFVGGPTSGDVAELFDVVKEVKQSKQPGLRRIEPIAESLVKRVPYFGAGMSNWMKRRYKETTVEQ